jgi:hypothetical protein
MLPDLPGAAQLRASGNTAYSSLGMTLISTNTLAFGKTDYKEFKKFVLDIEIWYWEAMCFWDFGNSCFEFS